MAIVVLVLWLFTAGAGFSLLATSNLRRTRPAASTVLMSAAEPAEPAAPAAEPATASVTSAAQAISPAQPAAKRASRAARDRFAPPSLVAARNAPVLPGRRALLEFAHPAGGIIGLGFWLGYTSCTTARSAGSRSGW